ncbi:MAG: hypothetical protein OQK55_02910, partial [Thermoanaerobaculales bacterium]|nr:hypothetical protein [Thermoanaerobaculales bacterium]
MAHEIKGMEVSDEGHPAVAEDTGLELWRPSPSQRASAGDGAGTAAMGCHCIGAALDSPTRVDQPPPELEI